MYNYFYYKIKINTIGKNTHFLVGTIYLNVQHIVSFAIIHAIFSIKEDFDFKDFRFNKIVSEKFIK